MTKNVTNVSKNFKAHWSLLRRLLNNKKIPLILLLFHKKKKVTNSKKKAELFNSHFATKCSLISSSSKIQSHVQYLADNRLSSVSL